jgi:L,D-transpeptidase catalytic domain
MSTTFSRQMKCMIHRFLHVAFLTMFLASCSGVVSVKMNATGSAVQGITFAADQGETYIPLDEAEQRLNLRIDSLDRRGLARKLTDGTQLISLKELTEAGANVEFAESGQTARVSRIIHAFDISIGAKRAEVNLSEQRLRAWQGERLVLETRVSSGRNGRTPSGDFRAGPYKARMHHSSLYENAPMPWSVQVNGNVFIHGFFSVPSYPASHGCVRVPLDEGNPARFFYEWIDVGTPVRIRR